MLGFSKYFFAFLIIVSNTFFIPACQNQNRIDEDKFVKIYTDMMIAQDSIVNKKEVDSSQVINPRTAARDSVLKNHNVSLAQYQATVDYYNQDPDRWQTFFEKVLAEVDSMKTRPPQ